MLQGSGYIVGVGAANVDVHGQSKNALVLRDSNPGRMHSSAGGVTRNILENAARLGADCRLVAALGTDVYAEVILESCQAAGIDTHWIVRVSDAASSTYISVLDDKGDMFIALSDMSIAKNLTQAVLQERAELLRGARLIVADGCLPPCTMRNLLDIAQDVTPVFVDPVSTAYAKAVQEVVGRFHTVKPNVLELEVLSGMRIDSEHALKAAARVLLDAGVQRVIVSRGALGCLYMDRDGREFWRALRPVERMVNATGGGDAFMGALAYSYVAGYGVTRTLDTALAAGIVAILADETINPEMSLDKVEKTIRERKQ